MQRPDLRIKFVEQNIQTHSRLPKNFPLNIIIIFFDCYTAQNINKTNTDLTMHTVQ